MATPSYNDSAIKGAQLLKTLTEAAKDLKGKADKVANATSGNLAALDSNGNLTDSGKKASDFATSAQGGKADSAIQGVKLNGASSALTPDSNNVVNIPDAVAKGTTGETNGLMTADDKQKLNGIANGAEANVQADWNETNSSSDAFIKNKPYFNKYVGSTGIKFKVCNLVKYSGGGSSSDGIEVFYRRGAGAVHGHLLHKATFELYLERIGDVSSNSNTAKFYYLENSSTVDIYAECGKYCRLDVAPLANMPKDRIDFTNFGTSVGSIPEGAVAINPVWVANSSASSGTAPVKVDAYGNLTAVPMDSTPTASSTNLMTSGAIKTALDNITTDFTGKADKATSGNGMLAVIGSNGNYSSSGITAYNQTQINGLFSGKVVPSLQKRSHIDEQIYEFVCNGQTVGKSVKFTDEYAGEDRLTFGLEFASDGTVLQFYLPINNFEENKWIWDGQTPGGSPVGVVELYASCIKNTNGNTASFSSHSNHAIDAYNGSTVVSARHFGGINVGSTTRQNDSYSKVNIMMKIMNTITGKYVVVTFDLGVTSYANGSANQAYAIGVARCNTYGFDI